MQKSGRLYKWILFLWGVFSLILLTYLAQECRNTDSVAVCVLLTLSILILIVFWLGSVKDLLFSVCYVIKRKEFDQIYQKVRCHTTNEQPAFVLLYCTYNDFNPTALLKSMEQDYPNVRTVILDDSTKEPFQKEIDEFALAHHVSVVRRGDRVGFKAGNLNHYLAGREDYDYFVVLDSDEVLPAHYISSVLKYFSALPRIGAVQARHVAGKAENAFQALLGMSIKSNGKTAQVVKNFYGANALLGHGMTISRPCYEATGGFPHVVAEDISMAVLTKNAGYEIVYAQDVECVEEFPYDYVSLKKRQCKWTQGNLEYMQRYHRDIMTSHMAWYEKLDMILSHYMLPLTPVLSFVLVTINILLGLFDYQVVRHSFFIYAAMTLFLLSPLVSDVFVYGRTKKAYLLLPYFGVNIVTYASMAPMMLRTVLRGVFGQRATFLVTPKEKRQFSLYDTFAYTIDSLLFAVVLAAFSYWSCKTIWPSVLLVGSCALAPMVFYLSNIGLGRKYLA